METGIILIAARTLNFVMGNTKNPGGLPWNFRDAPRDMSNFKDLTNGRHIVMGRKTADTLTKALPNRRNLVLSERKGGYVRDGFETVSIEKVLVLAKKEIIFCIGGREIYNLLYPFAKEFYLTVIEEHLDGDVLFDFFQNPRNDLWRHAEMPRTFPIDKDNKYPMTFYHYVWG